MTKRNPNYQSECSYDNPGYYYTNNQDGTISVIGIALDCAYLWDYGNQDRLTIEEAIEHLPFSIDYDNIQDMDNYDEDNDFIGLINPIKMEFIELKSPDFES